MAGYVLPAVFLLTVPVFTLNIACLIDSHRSSRSFVVWQPCALTPPAPLFIQFNLILVVMTSPCWLRLIYGQTTKTGRPAADKDLHFPYAQTMNGLSVLRRRGGSHMTGLVWGPLSKTIHNAGITRGSKALWTPENNSISSSCARRCVSDRDFASANKNQNIMKRLPWSKPLFSFSAARLSKQAEVIGFRRAGANHITSPRIRERHGALACRKSLMWSAWEFK